MDMHAQKMQRIQERMQQQAELTKLHLYMKEDINYKVAQNKNMAYTRTKQEALETKMDKSMNRELRQRLKQ